MKKGLMFVSALAAATLGLVACGGGGGGTTTYTVAITNKDAIRTLTDEDMSKSVSVTIDGDLQKAQDALQDGDLVISSTNEQVLQISGVNKLKPVAAGETTVKAVYKGFEDSVTVTVTATPKLKIVTDPQEGKDYFLASPLTEKVYATAHMAEGNAKFYMAGTKVRDEAAKIRIEKEGDSFYIKATDPNQTEGKYFGTATNGSGDNKHYNLGFFGNNVPGTDPAVPYAKAQFHLTDDFHIETHVDDSDLLVGTKNGNTTISLGDSSKVIPAYIYEEGAAEPATAVAISPRENVSAYVGGSVQLSAALTPASSTDTVTWKSSDVSKATVGASTGLVKGVAVGTVTITATALSGVKDEITVEIKDASTLNYGTKEAPLTPEQARALVDNFEAGKTIPQKITVAGVVYESGAESTFGGRNVWLKSTDGETNKYFEGYDVEKGEFTWIRPEADVLKGYTVTMTGWAMNYNGTYEITNKKTGQDNYDKGQLVTIPNEPVTGIELNKESLQMDVGGEDEQLTILAVPGIAKLDDEAEVSFDISPAGVATVSNTGAVHAVAAGTATITAHYNTLTATCTVKVEEPVVGGITVEHTIADLATARNWPISSGGGDKPAENFVLPFSDGENDELTISGEGQGNTGTVWASGSDKEIRFYANTTGNATVTFTAKTGYIIKSLKLTYVWTNESSAEEIAIENDVKTDINAASVTYTIARKASASSNPQFKLRAYSAVLVEAE